MKLKKVISLGLAVLMTASLFAGCGSEGSKESSGSEQSSQTSEAASSSAASGSAEESNAIQFPLAETMHFTTAVPGYKDDYPMADNPTWQYLQEYANIDIEILYAPLRAESKEKLKLVMAGGDYPDFLFKASWMDCDEYGMQGILIPLEDLIREYAPNLCALMDERNGWYEMEAVDGHIYSLPLFAPSQIYGNSDGSFFINEKWLDNLGLEMPTNLEELYEVLKAFKEKDANGNGDPNDEIPWTFAGGNEFKRLLTYIGDGLHYYGKHVTIMDDELIFYPYTDGYKEFIAEMAKWYKEGLIDKNALTQSTEQRNALAQSGDVIGMAWGTTAGAYIPQEYAENFATLPAFVPENLPLSTGVNKNAMAITDKCENPEVLIAWADYFYTKEGARIASKGLEGVHWTANADGTYSSAILDAEKYPNWGAYNLQGAWAYPGVKFTDYYADTAVEDTKPATYRAYVEKWHEGGLYSTGVVLPVLKFTEEEKEELSTMSTDINGYIDNYISQVVAGEVSIDDTWDDFQKALKTMGADDLLEIYKASYERALAAQ